MSKRYCTESFAPLLAALIAIAPAVSAAQLPVTDPTFACLTPDKGVNEAGYVEVGGIRQWITIEGQDCANPVVLIIRGGHGNPNTPFANNVSGNWAKEFAVVQRDQRCSGKIYPEGKPREGEVLTIEHLVEGLERDRRQLSVSSSSS